MRQMFTQKGTSLTNHFANECRTTLSLIVFIKRNFVADFLQAMCDFTCKTADLSFWAPFGGLGAMYDDHLRLIEKRVVDFLLVLIELFARCYGWGATSEYRCKIGDFAPMGAGWPKISGSRGRSPATILLLSKLGWMIFRMV